MGTESWKKQNPSLDDASDISKETGHPTGKDCMLCGWSYADCAFHALTNGAWPCNEKLSKGGMKIEGKH